MNLSRKCQYALRALFELAGRPGRDPVPVGEIAKAQAVPPRFLELILAQLKQAGYVESRRGVQGGYLLAVSPDELSIGDVIRFVEGPLAPVECIAGGETDCPLQGNCAFIGLWERARQAVADVYDNTTLHDLIEEHLAAARRHVPDYCI